MTCISEKTFKSHCLGKERSSDVVLHAMICATMFLYYKSVYNTNMVMRFEHTQHVRCKHSIGHVQLGRIIKA